VACPLLLKQRRACRSAPPAPGSPGRSCGADRDRRPAGTARRPSDGMGRHRAGPGPCRSHRSRCPLRPDDTGSRRKREVQAWPECGMREVDLLLAGFARQACPALGGLASAHGPLGRERLHLGETNAPAPTKQGTREGGASGAVRGTEGLGPGGQALGN
jgi:hypothetical protein